MVTSITIRDSDLGKQLPSIVKWFPNLRTLKLCNVRSNCHFVAASFKQLQHLTIDDAFCNNTSRGYRAHAELIRMNPQLQSIRLEIDRQLTMKNLLKIIKNNTAITKLTVTKYSSNFLVKLSEMQQLANEHPSLVELDLYRYQFTVKNAVVMLHRLRALKKVGFQIECASECTELQTKLNNQWEMAWNVYGIGSNYVQLNRKD